MSKLEELNYEENKAIKELQMRIESDLPPNLCKDSSLFYRFLKARDFDADKAEKMLRKHINWRKAHQIDTLLEDFKPKEVYQKYVEPSLIGLDKDGDIVYYFCAGKIDTKDVLKCMKMNDYVRNYIWTAEKAMAAIQDMNKKEGRISIQATVIVDLDKLTFTNATSNASMEAVLQLIHNYQDNYPERLKRVYVINAPSFFVFIFSILKAVMSNAMIQKIIIFGHSGWKEKLLECVSANVLPAFLGGNRTDPDGNPLCKTFIVHAGKTSPDYHLSNEDRFFKKGTQVDKIVVPQMGKKDICVEVTESGSLIIWKFLVKRKDIAFGLSFETSDKEVKELLPVERYTTSDGIEEGCYKSKSIGKYIIIFDNSYSMLNSKEIDYIVTVEKHE